MVGSAVRYWIGLGSNLGDRLGTLREAALALSAVGEIRGRSRVWGSSAVGGPPQPPFLNAALVLDSELSPLDVLHACQQVEVDLGRAREREAIRWGPRVLDVDILLAGARGERTIADPALEVPHPRLHERAFALAPLVELDHTLVHPALGRPLEALLRVAQRTQPLAPTGDVL